MNGDTHRITFFGDLEYFFTNQSIGTSTAVSNLDSMKAKVTNKPTTKMVATFSKEHFKLKNYELKSVENNACVPQYIFNLLTDLVAVLLSLVL